MKDDLEVSAARRPPGGGWWIDGRCGAVIFATLFGSLIFSAAFSLRNSADAAEQAPVFVTVVTVFRLLSYAWLGCIMAPLNWALRHVSFYIAAVLLFDLLLLAYSFGLMGSGALLAPPAFGSAALRVMGLLSLGVLVFAFARSLSGSFKAGVETTRLFGRVGTSGG